MAFETNFQPRVLSGSLASRPAATGIQVGTLYFSEDEGVIYEINQAHAWEAYGGGSGAATNVVRTPIDYVVPAGVATVIVTDTTASRTVTLPDPATQVLNRTVWVADGSNAAQAHPIRVVAAVGTVNGATFDEIDENLGGALYITDKVTWTALRATAAYSRIPPLDPTLYVATTGSDAAVGDAAHPLLTIPEALRRWSGGARGVATIQCGVGAFALPASPVAPPGCRALVIAGTKTASGLGTMSMTGASVSADMPTLSTVTKLGGGLAPSAWKRWFLRCVGGTAGNIGQRLEIEDNTAAVFSLVGSAFGGAFANNDTFVVESPGTQLTFGAGVACRGPVVFRDVEHAPDASFPSFGGDQIAAYGCWFGTNGNTVEIGGNVPANQLTAGYVPLYATGLTGATEGFTVNNEPVSVGSAFVAAFFFNPPGFQCAYQIFRSCLHGNACVPGVNDGATAQFSESAVTGTAGISCSDAMLDLYALRIFGGTGVLFSNAARGSIRFSTIDAVTGNAITVGQASVGVITVTSPAFGTTPNTGFGLQVTTLGEVMSDAGDSVRGTAGQVKIGANAPTTWVLVNGGLAANTSDYAAASPQYAVVRP